MGLRWPDQGWFLVPIPVLSAPKQPQNGRLETLRPLQQLASRQVDVDEAKVHSEPYAFLAMPR